MFCKDYGRKLNDVVKFCPECGCSVNTVTKPKSGKGDEVNTPLMAEHITMQL